MTDTVRISNMPDSGSNVRIALDLANRVWAMEHSSASGPGDNPRKAFLDLYAECLHATCGSRDF